MTLHPRYNSLQRVVCAAIANITCLCIQHHGCFSFLLSTFQRIHKVLYISGLQTKEMFHSSFTFLSTPATAHSLPITAQEALLKGKSGKAASLSVAQRQSKNAPEVVFRCVFAVHDLLRQQGAKGEGCGQTAFSSAFFFSSTMASMTATAVMFTMSRTELSKSVKWMGLFSPIWMGPTTSPSSAMLLIIL